MNACAQDSANSRDALSLLQLNTLVRDAISAAAGIHDVWITAETSDVRQSGPH